MNFCLSFVLFHCRQYIAIYDWYSIFNCLINNKSKANDRIMDNFHAIFSEANFTMCNNVCGGEVKGGGEERIRRILMCLLSPFVGCGTLKISPIWNERWRVKND